MHFVKFEADEALAKHVVTTEGFPCIKELPPRIWLKVISPLQENQMTLYQGWNYLTSWFAQLQTVTELNIIINKECYHGIKLSSYKMA